MYGHGGIIPPFRFDMMLMLMPVLMAEVCTSEHETTCRYLFLYCTEIRTAALRMLHKDNMKITDEMV